MQIGTYIITVPWDYWTTLWRYSTHFILHFEVGPKESDKIQVLTDQLNNAIVQELPWKSHFNKKLPTCTENRNGPIGFEVCRLWWWWKAERH